MSAKLATRDVLIIKIFWNRCCDIIISAHDIVNKILSCDSNSIFEQNILRTSTLFKDLTRNADFFES